MQVSEETNEVIFYSTIKSSTIFKIPLSNTEKEVHAQSAPLTLNDKIKLRLKVYVK
jgi:hypothetical protein